MDVDKTKRYTDALIANLILSRKFKAVKEGTQKVLIVEGRTDERFVEKLIKKGVFDEGISCITVEQVFLNKKERDEINCKNVIVSIVEGLSRYPMLINCPKGADKWCIYGMIDLDFEETGKYILTPRLFVTDTHDLETLLLSTDQMLLKRLKKCDIKDDEKKKAFFLAYQLGFVRQLLYKYTPILNIKCLSEDNVDYSRFETDCRISLKSFIEYVNENSQNRLSSAKIKALFEQLSRDKSIKKRFDDEFLWKKSWDTFSIDDYADFWQKVNGHDILSILRYVNAEASRKYANKSNYSLNRNFEMDLIENYYYPSFEKTNMYENMRANKVTKDHIEEL